MSSYLKTLLVVLIGLALIGGIIWLAWWLIVYHLDFVFWMALIIWSLRLHTKIEENAERK